MNVNCLQNKIVYFRLALLNVSKDVFAAFSEHVLVTYSPSPTLVKLYKISNILCLFCIIHVHHNLVKTRHLSSVTTYPYLILY